jgi:hypothetical protein
MWSALLSNIKYDECDMHSLDDVTKGRYGFSSRLNLPAKICNKIFSSSFTSSRETTSNYFELNKKLVQAFLFKNWKRPCSFRGFFYDNWN